MPTADHNPDLLSIPCGKFFSSLLDIHKAGQDARYKNRQQKEDDASRRSQPSFEPSIVHRECDP
jgi:hypothetical protein